MRLCDFDRVIVMAADRRFPILTGETLTLLRSHGATNAVPFINGRGGRDLIHVPHDLLHVGAPDPSWTGKLTGWDYIQAYRHVLGQALTDGVDSLLLVEDDIQIGADYDAIMRRVQVPDDWGLFYFGCLRWWETTPPQPAGPYLLRLTGSQIGAHAIGWRPAAMQRFLELPITTDIDWLIAQLHTVVPAYCLTPSMIEQRSEIVSVLDPPVEQ